MPTSRVVGGHTTVGFSIVHHYPPPMFGALDGWHGVHQEVDPWWNATQRIMIHSTQSTSFYFQTITSESVFFDGEGFSAGYPRDTSDTSL